MMASILKMEAAVQDEIAARLFEAHARRYGHPSVCGHSYGLYVEPTHTRPPEATSP